MGDIVSAMMSHPDLVAGKRRLCTALMNAYPGEILVKVGAAGVYGAALMERGLGIAIKAVDGDPRAAAVALLHVLEGLGVDPPPSAVLADFARPVVLNTNLLPVGHYEPIGSLSFNTSRVG